MEPNTSPPIDPFAQAPNVGARPARPNRAGRTAAIVVVSVVGLAILVGIAVVAVLSLFEGSDAEAEATRPFAFEPEADGRTYSSEGGASIIIPATWTHIPLDADAAAFDSATTFDFLGLWQVAPAAQGGAATVSLTAGERGRPLSGARDELVARFGEVGDKTVDGDGITYTVLGLEDWSVPSITQSAWIEVEADYGNTGAEGYEGVIRGRRCYYLAAHMEKLFACVEADFGDLDGATTAVESALLTVEFAR